MMDVSLRELCYVATLERERNFTRAAAAIPMAQPALSQAIARIERRIGVQLFIRTSRVVEPTKAGELLANRARRIADSVDAAIADTRRLGGHGRLRVHVPEPAIPPMRRLSAEIRREVSSGVQLVTVPASEIATQLMCGDLDIAVGSRQNGPSLCSEVLCMENVQAMMDNTHALAGESEVTVEQLSRYPMVSIDRTMSSWDQAVERLFRKAGLRLNWTESTAFGLVAGADLVIGTDATLLVLDSIAADAVSGRRCVPIDPPWSVGWYVTYRTTSQNTAPVDAAITAVRKCFRDSLMVPR